MLLVITVPVDDLTASPSLHLLRVLTRHSLIETSVNDKQLSFIENQLRQKQIPHRRMSSDGDGIIIVIGPFHKPTTSATRHITLKSDENNVDSIAGTSDRGKFLSLAMPIVSKFDSVESYEFRHCLETCEVLDEEELKPDHDCIRKKCLEDITGI